MGATWRNESIVIDPSAEGSILFEYWRPTRDWIRSSVFRLMDAGVGALILREGDLKRGAVLIVLVEEDGKARICEHVRTPSGHSHWVLTHAAQTLSSEAASVRLEAAIRRDPDLWILMIDAPTFDQSRKNSHINTSMANNGVRITKEMSSRMEKLFASVEL